jgi:ankyrin repeat protein
LQSGYDVHSYPLDNAVLAGSVHEASLLLDAGAQPDGVMPSGYSYLGWSVHQGNEELVKLLLKSGCSVYPLDNSRPALEIAIIQGHGAIAKILLEHNADSSMDFGRGVTPLHCAIENGRLEMISLLLDFGADITKSNYASETPIDLAHRLNHAEIIALLNKYLVSTNHKTVHKTIRENKYKMLRGIREKFPSTFTQSTKDFFEAIVLNNEKKTTELLRQVDDINQKNTNGVRLFLWRLTVVMHLW